jgi:hypothetical protein
LRNPHTPLCAGGRGAASLDAIGLINGIVGGAPERPPYYRAHARAAEDLDKEN